MKIRILTIALAFLSFGSVAQKNWPALADMKTVMKQTFPPLMKSNDLTATKSNARLLYEKAVALQSAKKPRAFRKSSMEEKFESITNHAKELNSLVSTNAPDEDIKSSMVVMHAAFAEIAHHKKAGGKKH